MNFLDYSGLQRFLDRLKAIIPTKTSDIQNDSGYLTQHNPVDSALSTTSENAVQNKVVKGALDGKSDSGHTHSASEVSGLSTVATSGSYNDLSNTPTIPTVNNKTLTIQKNGTTVNTFTANSASDVTANITVPTAVSELTNDSGYLTSASSLDSSKLTGTIDIARLPKGALERLVTVANQTARFALTVNDVQLGDTVKQLDTGVMYIVTDETKLSSADGYTEYTAGSATSVPWSGVTGKPSSFTPSSHTHGNVTNDGKLPTASRALISDSSKNITVSSVTDTELGYLSGVTSSVQTQLNGKAASNHVHGSITNDGKLGTASRALVTDSSKKIAVSTVTATELGYVSGVTSAIQTQLNGKAASNHVHGNISNDGKVGTTANKPLITGTGGVVQAGSFGNAANTFCEGNDSRLSDARTPVAHTHLTSDVTDLLNSDHTWTGDNTYSKPVVIERKTDTGNFLALKNTVAELGSTPASATPVTIAYRDKNDENLGYMGVYYDTDGSNIFRVFIRNKFASGSPSTSGSTDYTTFQLKLNPDKTKEAILKASLRPYDNNAYNLGSLTYRWNAVYSCGSNVRSGNIDFTDTTTTGMKEHWHFSNAENSGAAFFHIGSQRNHSLGLNEEHFRIKNVNGLWADLYIQLDDNNQFTIGTTTHSDVTNNGFRGKFTPLGSFIPYVNNSYDLGSSTYQWNNTYTKKLYLNGTEFGLDTANTWTAQNSFNSDLNLNYASTDVDDIVNSVAGSATLDNFVHMTGNETVNGIKSFPDGIVANVTGSATSATQDGSGNVITNTYGKLGATNEWTKVQQINGGDNKGLDIINGETEKGVVPSVAKSSFIWFSEKNDNFLSRICHRVNPNGSTILWLSTCNYYKNGVLDPTGNTNTASFVLSVDENGRKSSLVNCDFRPDSNNNFDLGTSSYQWKSVYAQSYYYNGTEFQNKFVTLDSAQTITSSKAFETNINTANPPATMLQNWKINFAKSDDTNGGYAAQIGVFQNADTSDFCAVMRLANPRLNNKPTSGVGVNTNNCWSGIGVYYNFDLNLGYPYAGYCGKWDESSNSDAHLASTSWVRRYCETTKGFIASNDINPGALSLPDTLGVSGTENVNYFNVIGYLNNTGTPATIPSTATYDGWLYINAKDGAGSYITVDDNPSSFGTSVYGNNGLGSQSVGLLCLICPIRAGHSYSVRIKSDGIVNARIYPAQGNV